MNRIGHVMILASAGSGKTYALTNRYVRLLALGAAPDRIAALTFTRKAAGEFFDEILNKLARAVRDPGYARQLAAEIGLAPPAVPPDFLALLRAVTDSMHRLRLGTLDGFFARIARSFPLELGLSGDFEVLEEHSARMERARVLRRLFERTGELAPEQREFIEAFKRATFGAEEKRLGAQLDAYLDEHQEVFLSAPEGDVWGNPGRIWPDGTQWLLSRADVAGAIRTLRQWAGTAPLADRQRERWRQFLEACGTWTPGVVPAQPLEYVLAKAIDAWRSLEAGNAVLAFDRRRQELDAAACGALVQLTRHVVGGELARRLEITRGIHAVLAGYERIYHDAVRRAGKLTFGDVQRLLQPDAGAPVLGSGAADDAAERRLAIDYRLDGEIDHWLLDEFQDTSFGQWSVLRNLVDEAVQDPTGRRSFFYVGDVKQAIFAWREGDPRLFREIFDHYNAMRPGIITEEHLDKSWRSGPAVIDTVNRVFGAAAVLNELFPGAAVRAWNREWRAHETARPGLGGQVALLHAPDETARFATTLEVLREIAPLQRGLSCAVLVQRNDTAAALADFLRREGSLPAVAESDLHVCTDNPAGSALLALAQVAAHPGDRLAWWHLQMTPLRAVLAEQGWVAPEDITRQLLTAIHADGFERTLTTWARRLENVLPADDDFTRERLRQFTLAAARFDATGSRDVAEFIAFMERHSVREPETSAVIRVLTIHKSKGLGFDVVILPDLEGQKLDCRRDGLAVHRASDRNVEWVLDLPGRLFHAADEVLAGHVREAEAAACYEAISLLYVAMTRAKRAMYLVTKPPGSSTSRNYPRLLAEALGADTGLVSVGGRELPGAFTIGDPQWNRALTPPATTPPPVAALPVLGAAESAAALRFPARVASGSRVQELSGAQLFSLDRGTAAEFGTAVHQLLAEVDRLEGTQPVPVLTAAWTRRGFESEAVAEAAACLQSPGLARVWHPPPAAEIWRERAFEIVLDATWVTGVFDRVVVERDAGGRPLRATVFDFKTDRAERDDLARLVRRHGAQLAAYRRVAAVLAGLPPERVTAELIFTRWQQAVAVA